MAMRAGTPAFFAGLTGLFSVLLATAPSSPAVAQSYKVVIAVPAKMTGGTTAFINASSKRVIEIDSNGKTVWQCSLAAAQFKSAELQRGADLEWIKSDDTFLIAVPFSGVFRIDRKCNVVWRYQTAKVSHDADLLPNGNVLHAWAWDSAGDDQAVEVDPSGKIVWRWQARDHVDRKWAAQGKGAPDKPKRGPGSGQGGGRGEGFTHTNAVVRLPNGDTLVSLRNFHRVVRVAPDGTVRRSWGPINYVHEPSVLPDGSLLAAQRSPMIVAIYGRGPRQTVFANDIGISPIRTVEQLDRGNLLLTGGEDIVEIDKDGEVVWHVKIFGDLGVRERDGVYKAVRVSK
ncbi:MAG TPA: aryl-sulfate sulfotransferase [Xanthobacteraceae bacterium]|nr:aryl-sulfate sulfotransferase [Xanthobacteraceae bacterium]